MIISSTTHHHHRCFVRTRIEIVIGILIIILIHFLAILNVYLKSLRSMICYVHICFCEFIFLETNIQAIFPMKIAQNFVSSLENPWSYAISIIIVMILSYIWMIILFIWAHQKMLGHPLMIDMHTTHVEKHFESTYIMILWDQFIKWSFPMLRLLARMSHDTDMLDASLPRMLFTSHNNCLCHFIHAEEQFHLRNFAMNMIFLHRHSYFPSLICFFFSRFLSMLFVLDSTFQTIEPIDSDGRMILECKFLHPSCDPHYLYIYIMYTYTYTLWEISLR